MSDSGAPDEDGGLVKPVTQQFTRTARLLIGAVLDAALLVDRAPWGGGL